MPADSAASPGTASDRPPPDGPGEGAAPTFESRFRARSYELDSFDHVNHAVFLNWLEQARFDTFESGGFPGGELAASGWAVVVVRVEVDYHAEVRLGDEVVVRTRLAESRNTSMTFEQRVVRVPRAGGHGEETPREEAPRQETPGERTLAAAARVVLVWLRDGRPRRIPPDILEALGAP